MEQMEEYFRDALRDHTVDYIARSLCTVATRAEVDALIRGLISYRGENEEVTDF